MTAERPKSDTSDKDRKSSPDKSAFSEAPAESQASASVVEQSRDDFSRVVANLTHELKTPLHSILAVASVLASEVDGPLNEEQKRQVAMIVRNGDHLLEMITELLQFSSTTTSSRRLNMRRLKVRALFEEIIRGLEPVAGKTSVSIEADLERLDAEFCSDQTLLARIVSNLLSNAVKFSPDGGMISFFAETLGDGGLRIQVADSGIGMGPEVQQAVFAQFYQADAGDTRRFGGVGLGLALVKSSLDLLGGTIEVKSEPEQGSLFTVSIPSAADAVPKSKVLILDQDESVRLSLSECFNTQGYESFFPETEESLMREIAELQPDLLMLDVQASSGSGFLLLEEIRKTSWGEAIPIILMSTLEGPDDRARGFRLGASDFIVKPFNVEELLARVRAQLEQPW